MAQKVPPIVNDIDLYVRYEVKMVRMANGMPPVTDACYVKKDMK